MPEGDLTLYAQWEQKEYVLKFDPNTTDPVSNMPTDIHYYYGDQITIPNQIPQRDGYTFTGWNTTSDGTGTQYQPGDRIIGIEGDQILYAQWTPNPVNIVYDANTQDPVQNVPDTETRIPGEVATISNEVPLRDGYSFIAWNTQPDGTGTAYQPGENYIVPENGLTLYAQWQANNYILHYEPNATTPVHNIPGDQSYLAGETATVSNQVPNRIGYTFSNWNTEANGGGIAYAPGDTFTMPASDVVLYAQWEPIEYVLHFDPNTTDPVSNMPDDVTYHYGDQIIISSQIPERNGYTFTGWNTRADGLGTQIQPGQTIFGLDTDQILYAQWTPNPVNVIYDANTTDPVENLPPMESHIPGQMATISNQIPTRVGYRFTGWNTQPDGTGTAYQPGENYMVPQNGLTLYAQWETNQEILHFDPNTTDPVQNLPDDINYVVGETVMIPNQTPTRDNYVFTGWNTRPDGTGTTYQPGDTLIGPEGGLTLYAQWDVRQDVINFNPNTTDPVQNLPPDINYAPGETVTLPNEVATREDHTFIGWNTRPDGTGTTYQPGDTLIGPEGGLTLYAQWETNQNPPIIIIVIITVIGIGLIIFAITISCEKKCNCKCKK